MSLIQSLMTGTYVVTRSCPSKYVKGRYIPGVQETLTLSGSLQPLNAKELKLVPEGDRLKQYYKLYSDQPLFTVKPSSLAAADVVTLNGETYKVYSVESWTGTDLPYFKSILYREPEQATEKPEGA
jgi:hypothetical protein